MARFGGNEFTDFSVPLLFENRYFIMEPGNPPQITVFIDNDGESVFEVLKNKPADNILTNVSITPVGVITVFEKETDNFLYKVRPRYETSVVFGRIISKDITVRITDHKIQVDGSEIANNKFDGKMGGVEIMPNGGIVIGFAIPQYVLKWLLKAANS